MDVDSTESDGMLCNSLVFSPLVTSTIFVPNVLTFRYYSLNVCCQWLPDRSSNDGHESESSMSVNVSASEGTWFFFLPIFLEAFMCLYPLKL